MGSMRKTEKPPGPCNGLRSELVATITPSSATVLLSSERVSISATIATRQRPVTSKKIRGQSAVCAPDSPFRLGGTKKGKMKAHTPSRVVSARIRALKALDGLASWKVEKLARLIFSTFQTFNIPTCQ